MLSTKNYFFQDMLKLMQDKYLKDGASLLLNIMTDYAVDGWVVKEMFLRLKNDFKQCC